MLSATVAKADLSEATNAQRGSAAQARSAPFQFLDNDRWTQTATDGAGLGQGNATTITWGIVPDSTEIPAEGNFESESEAPSNLIAFMDGIYNSAADPLQDKAWFSLFEQVFDSWSTVSGITFIHEPNDDGAAFAKTNAPSGVLGTRPDIRIGGHAIDQDANTLAYAFFPNHGDMVIDTSDQFYADTSNNSLGFRNLVAHELGHALGIDHVAPIDGTKLMEAFVSPTIDGPQHDDILAVNRGYGDRLEKSGGNDTPRTAFDLGALDLETVSVDNVSIDDNSDLDYYGFTVGTGHAVTVTLSPVGSIYRSGAENGTVAAFNSQAQSDLTLAIIGTNGVTELATANSNGAGSSEVLANVVLAGAGQFYVKVTGSANAAQQYTLNLTITDAVADASVGGLVWNDTDGDGALGEAEVGIDGVTVALHLDDGDGVFEETTEDPLVASMDTADGGAFDFADLASGPYWVNVLDSPAVLEGFAQTSGAGPLLVNLDVSEDFNDADFGYQQQDATIGNLVWNDANGDGVYDTSEISISDVNVLLYLDDGDGQFEGGGEDTLRSVTVTSSAPAPTSTATDSPVSSIGSNSGIAVNDDGYDFINLPAGHYWVAVDDSSAALTGFGMTGGTTPLLVDLAPGEDFDDADFGYQQQDATIGNLLWDDSNGNGHHDHDEVGIDGVTITLYSDDGDSIFEGGSEDTLVASTVTADGGDYDFTDLSLGTYWVDVDENSDLLSGFALSGGSDPHSVNLAAGEDFNDADFGYFKLVTLSGTKFDDVDGDGVKDAGDPGLAEWEIELDIDSNGTIDQTVLTEADGTYRFANIGPGTHTLGEVLQAEFVQTAPIGGVQTVTPQSGQDVADLDFGNFALAQIRGTKFADENANGGRDADEGGLAGWTMFLDDNANGVLDESETAVVTDANGDYVFPGLPPGTYTVAAELREGFVRTLPQFADELFGQNEIPPIATDGSGQVHAVFDVTTNTLQLDIRFAGLADDITAIHMHRGGPGETGPIIYDLDERFGLAGNFASPVIGAMVIGQEDLVDLRNGNLYVNLHTSAEPAGELRAQIQPVTAYTISPSSGEVIEDRDFGNAPLTEISFGDGIARKVVVTENDGTLGTVSLRRGSGSLSLLGGNIQQDGKRKLNITGQNVRVHSVTIDQSESETVLRLRARGGDRRLHVTDITVEGPIGNIRGKRAVVHGNVHVMGTANRATFDQFIGPSQLTIGQWDGRQIVKLSVNDAFDLSVTSRAPLSLTAGQVLNTDGVTDTIEVPFVHKLRVVKNFAADLVLTATATKRSINKAVIGGWLENANITAPNDIRTMILGGIRNATVHSGVRQGFTTDDGDSLPDSADDFTPNQAKIHRFVVRGIKDEPFSVINSTVAAWTLKRVKIHRVKTDEIASHGFAAHRIGSYMRLREESFSPRSTKMTGPVIFDALDRYAVELVSSGRV